MAVHRTFKRAVLWAYTMRWGEKGFGALFAFILASMLGPRAFGAVALAMIYIAFVQMILDQGLFAAVVQRKDLQPEHLDAVFWLNIGVSLALIGLSVALSGWWARVNHLLVLEPVISVLSVIVLIEALAKVQRAILQREMDFKRLAIMSNGAVAVGGIVGLVMAFEGYGVWALVGQRISEDTAALVLLWTLGQWRPRLRFSLEHLKDLLGFSIATFVSKLGNFAYSQADAVLMGIFFGPAAVGLFRLAQKLVNLILDTGTSSLQIVAFSQFSRLQDRPAELRRSVLKCLRLASIVTFPALAGLAISSRQLVALLGNRWAPAADALTVLCPFGMLFALCVFTGPLLLARSRARLMAGLTWTVNSLNLGVMFAVVVYLKDGAIGNQVLGMALVRLIVAAALMAPVFLFFLFRFSQIRIRDFARTIAPSVGAAVASAASVAVVNATALLSGTAPAVPFVADVFVGGVAGIGTLLLLDTKLLAEVTGLVLGGLRPSAPEAEQIEECVAAAGPTRVEGA